MFQVDLSKINVFYMEEAGQSLVDVPVAPEIKNILKDAALYLKTNYGCQAERVIKLDPTFNNIQYSSFQSNKDFSSQD